MSASHSNNRSWSVYLLATLVAVISLGMGCGQWGTPSIEHQCSMNGLGSGSCTFTNIGTAPGSICGHARVANQDRQHRRFEEESKSTTICSGEVPIRATTEVAFTVPDVRWLCDPSKRKQWSDVCVFHFDLDPSSIAISATFAREREQIETLMGELQGELKTLKEEAEKEAREELEAMRQAPGSWLEVVRGPGRRTATLRSDNNHDSQPVLLVEAGERLKYIAKIGEWYKLTSDAWIHESRVKEIVEEE